MHIEAESAEIRIGSRLKRLIALRGQTYRSFSDQTGIPYRTLQDYLADKAKPGADQLARIAATGIDINLILTGRARRMGYLIPDAALPADDEANYILADIDVVNAIDDKAKSIMNEVIADRLKNGETLDFHSLFDVYLRLFTALADVFSKSNPPIAHARAAGMPLGQLTSSILDVAARLVAAKMSALYPAARKDQDNKPEI